MKNSETHHVCNKHNIGDTSVCCGCTGKTDCSNETTDTRIQRTFYEDTGNTDVVIKGKLYTQQDMDNEYARGFNEGAFAQSNLNK